MFKKLRQAIQTIKGNELTVGYIGKGETCGIEALLSKKGRSLFSYKVISPELEFYRISSDTILKHFTSAIINSTNDRLMKLIDYRAEYILKKNDLRKKGIFSKSDLDLFHHEFLNLTRIPHLAQNLSKQSMGIRETAQIPLEEVLSHFGDHMSDELEILKKLKKSEELRKKLEKSKKMQKDKEKALLAKFGKTNPARNSFFHSNPSFQDLFRKKLNLYMCNSNKKIKKQDKLDFEEEKEKNYNLKGIKSELKFLTDKERGKVFLTGSSQFWIDKAINNLAIERSSRPKPKSLNNSVLNQNINKRVKNYQICLKPAKRRKSLKPYLSHQNFYNNLDSKNPKELYQAKIKIQKQKSEIKIKFYKNNWKNRNSLQNLSDNGKKHNKSKSML